jgi:hypothetical protein
MSKRSRSNPATSSLSQLFDGSRDSLLELDSKDFFDQVVALVESGADVSVTIEGVEEYSDEDGDHEDNYSTTPMTILLEAYYDLKKWSQPYANVEELIHYFLTKDAEISEATLWFPTLYNDTRMLEELLKRIDDPMGEQSVFSEEATEVFSGFGHSSKVFN